MRVISQQCGAGDHLWACMSRPWGQPVARGGRERARRGAGELCGELGELAELNWPTVECATLRALSGTPRAPEHTREQHTPTVIGSLARSRDSDSLELVVVLA